MPVAPVAISLAYNSSPSGMDIQSYLFGKNIYLVSKHQKENVIAPLFAKAFQANLQVLDFDTDTLGTFSGEIERPASQSETALLKIEAFAKQYPFAKLIMSSEGAFFPHPEIPMLTVNTELVVLKSFEQNWVVKGFNNTYETNAASITVKDWSELETFANKIGFPEQGIILMSDEPVIQERKIYKNNPDIHSLHVHFDTLIQNSNTVIAETDLRAMHNPTRMQQIGLATENLIENLLSSCPNCNTPGFSKKDMMSGLPCCWCNTPTRLTGAYIYSCDNCQFKKEEKVKEPCADPQYCDVCNP